VIEVRVAALETAAALEHVITTDGSQLGFDLAKAVADADPALRRAAIELVPRPTASGLRATLVGAIGDADADVALAAAQALCADVADDPKGVKAALGADGVKQIAALVKAHPNASATRDAARCLK
jgi:hypothetical protein